MGSLHQLWRSRIILTSSILLPQETWMVWYLFMMSEAKRNHWLCVITIHSQVTTRQNNFNLDSLFLFKIFFKFLRLASVHFRVIICFQPHLTVLFGSGMSQARESSLTMMKRILMPRTICQIITMLLIALISIMSTS